jgi:hypothetical protein
MMAKQLADDADRPAAVLDADVHVHAADQHAARRPLQVVDQVDVALMRTHDLVAGQTERVRARTHDA